MKTKSKMTVLRTVYPPISDALASDLKNDPAVEKMLRCSNLYMIGIRPRARLIDFELTKDGLAKFNFTVAGHDDVPVTINISELPGVDSYDGETFRVQVDCAGTGFRIWTDEPHASQSELLEWFTTESLLWYAARGRKGIYGLENSRTLSTFELLYIGIARESDSFERLLKKGHEKRVAILSAEHPRACCERVSEEVTLFFFKADPVVATTIDSADDVDDELIDAPYDSKRILADAEKAFVQLLEPKYNSVTYKKYPKGADGVYEQGFSRYSYVIGEEMVFTTHKGTIAGCIGKAGLPTTAADGIYVEGDNVWLVKSGEKFPYGNPDDAFEDT